MSRHSIDDCTTKTCSVCGRELPATLEFFFMKGKRFSPRCRECNAMQCRDSYAANRKKRLEKMRVYRQEHLEAVRQKDRDYYTANRETRLVCVKQYSEDHPEVRRKASRVYYEKHKEKVSEYHRKYRKEHPELTAAIDHNRRAAKKGNGGVHTAADIKAQYKRQSGKCFYCGKNVKKDYHTDHVIPLVLGGSNGPENLVISCPKCNCKKGAKHPQDFIGILF